MRCNSKIHVIKDESLGGIEREYIEVERKADVGEKVVLWSGRVTQVFGLDDEIISDGNQGYCHRDYFVLEPTDIVHIDGERYRMVDRRAEVGERAIYYFEGKSDGIVFVVLGSGIRTIDVDYEDEEGVNVCGIVHGYYRVLVPVEEESESSPQSIEDLIANLATRMSAIERRVTIIEDKAEAQAKKLADIGRSTWYLEDDVTYAKEARYQLALDIRDIKARLEATSNALRKGD